MLTRIFSFIRLVVKTILFVAAFALLLWAFKPWGYIKPALASMLPARVVSVPVERKQPDLAELLDSVPAKYNVPPMLLAAIVKKESAGRRDAIRFEPSQMGRARAISKDPEQQRMLSSSHGLCQVMGWWSPEFKVSWADLYDQETNIEIASAILKKCMDKHTGKARVAQLRGALVCYNGSEAYAADVLNTIGASLMEKYL